MLEFLPYVLRSVFRNRVRTVLTLFGLLVVVGIYCFLASVESSMNRTVDSAAQASLLVMSEKDQW